MLDGQMTYCYPFGSDNFRSASTYLWTYKCLGHITVCMSNEHLGSAQPNV